LKKLFFNKKMQNLDEYLESVLASQDGEERETWKEAQAKVIGAWLSEVAIAGGGRAIRDSLLNEIRSKVMTLGRFPVKKEPLTVKKWKQLKEQQAKGHTKPLSRRKRIKLVSGEGPIIMTFEMARDMNEQWKSYCKRKFLKQEVNFQNLQTLDLHGALVKVTKATCKLMLGIEGIIIQETAKMLVIFKSRTGLVRKLPKPDIEVSLVIIDTKVLKDSDDNDSDDQNGSPEYENVNVLVSLDCKLRVKAIKKKKKRR